MDVEAAVNGRQECQRSLRSGDFECAPAGDGIPPEGVSVDEKDEHPNAPVTSRLGDAPPLEPAFEGKLSLGSHREGQDRLPYTAPADRSGFPPTEVTQPTQCDGISKFGESIRDLLRESPMKFKDLYPAIAERYPEQCPTQGTKVSLAAMAWLSEIQHDLQQIAVNLQGVWHLKDGAKSQASVQKEDSPNHIRKSRSKIAKTQRRQFPYIEIATLWNEGRTISEIANTIGRVDHDNPKDPFHSLRNCLCRMHKAGYVDASGQRVKLSYRVSEATVSKATIAGRRWKENK